MTALLFFLAGAALFYGAWSIDFAWNARENDRKVGLPIWPGRHLMVSPHVWFWHAIIVMFAGWTLIILSTFPPTLLLGVVGYFLTFFSLPAIGFVWLVNHPDHAFIWNVAFFFGVVLGTLLMVVA